MKKTIFAILLTVAAAAYAAPAHYSKLGIVTGARKLGRLDAMNAWIQQAGYWNEWLACQVFSDDYEGFAQITNAVVASGLATSAEIAAILEASRVENETGRLRALVESDKGLREKYHGGRIGQYILTNETGRIIRVDLYADSTVWTNGYTYGVNPLLDPEAMAKAIAEAKAKAEAERERVRAAWEAANLPPDLAELRRKQREAERQAKEAEEQ
jgi:hypothetical protein